MIAMIGKELLLRKEYLSQTPIHSIYFGGGTPSLLNDQELSYITNLIFKHYQVSEDAEFTIEVNPDDITNEKCHIFKSIGINRLSVGIQSFNDDNLKSMNRIHKAEDSIRAVYCAQNTGLDNISIDLIFAIPGSNIKILEQDLIQSCSLNIKHISTYGMTIEEKTVFGHLAKKEKLQVVDEELAAAQYEIIMQHLCQNGFEHYEISNFALPGFRSKHNSSYWKETSYMGIGPGAHSYNGESRQFNIPHNIKYIQSIEENNIPSTIEILTDKEKINDYILTSIRTIEGCDLKHIEKRFSYSTDHILGKLEHFAQSGHLLIDKGVARLTTPGKLIADKITLELILV